VGVNRKDSSLRVFVEPVGLFSRAMVRVADALTRYAPAGVEIVSDLSPSECDLVVLHVIGRDAISVAENVAQCGQRYAVIQYCLQTAGAFDDGGTILMWYKSVCVWSYYDMVDMAKNRFSFLYAPLGLDDAFLGRHYPLSPRIGTPLVLTSGYVSGPGAEPIAEVWEAAGRLGIDAIHVGPSKVEGMTQYPPKWTTRHQISDTELAELYWRATWVAALRHVEGLEIMGVEGLACGARPVCFDQPAMKRWYGDHAIYVKDQSGPALVDELVSVMSKPPLPVSDAERAEVVQVFNWERVCTEFWRRVVGGVGEVAA
jgi:glycosyltransferase involved in cell wall biosynthesis